MFRIHVFFLLFATPWAYGARVVYKDSVMIDANPSPVIVYEDGTTPYPDTVVVENEPEAATVRSAGGCITTEGQQGQCTVFSDCFPTLFSIIPGSEDEYSFVQNQVLAEMLVNSSGTCNENSDEPINMMYVLTGKTEICCPPQETVPPPLSDDDEIDENILTDEDKILRQSCGYAKAKADEIYYDDEIDEDLDEEKRIVNGREAKKGEFPWIVALMQSGREFCGGSLIDSQTVLTAAHCVQQMSASQVSRFTIQIGDHNIYSTADGTHVTRKATRIYYNKKFSMRHLHHDVAIVKLDRPVTFNDRIQPICIHSPTPGTYAQVAGWGQVVENGRQPATLRAAKVKVWSHDACVRKYGSQAPSGIGQGMLCAGGSGPDSCRGDSGGPLSANSKPNAQQIGLVSFGIGCGTYPGVYTRVDKYKAWIQRTKNLS